MSTEELISEIVSKKCPFHGMHPIVEVHKVGRMNISTCCVEFQEEIGNILNSEVENPFNSAPSLEII